jgi:hypothetical protein
VAPGSKWPPSEYLMVYSESYVAQLWWPQNTSAHGALSQIPDVLPAAAQTTVPTAVCCCEHQRPTDHLFILGV